MSLMVPENFASVTPSDSADLSVSGVLWVGGAGNVKIDGAQSGTVTFVGVPAGTLLRVRARRVYSTGTTATSILVGW